MKVFTKARLILSALFAAILLFVGISLPNQTAEAETMNLEGKNVAFLITEGFHDAETLFPKGYLINYGANVTLIGEEPGSFTAYNSDVTLSIEKTIADVSVDEFDALVIPGGHSPGNLRENDDVIGFVQNYMQSDKPVAAICHGPQVLVTADVISGRNLTGFEAVEDEITEAGADFQDTEVLVDGNIITSRIPDDLPAFSREIAIAIAD